MTSSHDLPSEAEVISYFDTLSNWGRWGADDSLGTLNYITEQVRADALQSARRAVTVSCAWTVSDLDRRTEVFGDPNADAEADPGASRALIAMEDVSFRFHGWEMTHLDALSHMAWEGKAYNGHPISDITPAGGAPALAITDIPDGVLTRGVLLDVPSVAGDLAPGQPVTIEMLEAAEERHGTKVRSGDAVLIRTGFGSRRLANGGRNPEDGGRPGLDPRCLGWLHEREAAVLGGDATHDAEPFPYSAIPAPVHAVGMVAMGLWLIDNLNLEDLSRACAEARQHHFLFMVAPLRLEGVTGSAVNPIAVL